MDESTGFWGAISLFVLALLVLVFFGSISVIGTGKIGVVTQFGKVTGRELSEGFNFKAPWPFQSVRKYDIKVQKEEADAAAASKDLQDVNSKLVLNYRLDAGQVSEIHQTIGSNYREKVIDPALQEIFKASSAKFTASELITERAKVKDDVAKLLTERLEKFGIAVVDVSLVNFSFSPEFTRAIEAKQVAQQNAERANFQLQQAQLDAQAQEVQKQTLSPLLLQKWAIDKWNGQLPTYLGGGSVFNIPLQGQ